MPVPPVTSVQPEAPDNLLEALRGASIVDEHRVLMDTVIEKIQFVRGQCSFYVLYPDRAG